MYLATLLAWLLSGTILAAWLCWRHLRLRTAAVGRGLLVLAWLLVPPWVGLAPFPVSYPVLEGLWPSRSVSGPCPFWGNPRSRIVHTCGCHNYPGLQGKPTWQRFATLAEAEQAGYRLARNCPSP